LFVKEKLNHSLFTLGNDRLNSSYFLWFDSKLTSLEWKLRHRTRKLSGFNSEAKLPLGISYLTFGFHIEATKKPSGFNIEAKLPIGISYLTFGFHIEATKKLSGFNIEAKLPLGISYLTFGFHIEATRRLSGFIIEAKLPIGISYLTRCSIAIQLHHALQEVYIRKANHFVNILSCPLAGITLVPCLLYLSTSKLCRNWCRIH
jgi:D-alanyl-lipoteichoic acid acyltransferase DltB (MBOAT superfamily)